MLFSAKVWAYWPRPYLPSHSAKSVVAFVITEPPPTARVSLQLAGPEIRSLYGGNDTTLRVLPTHGHGMTLWAHRHGPRFRAACHLTAMISALIGSCRRGLVHLAA